MLETLRTEDALVQAANLLMAMSNARRMVILGVLTDREMPVGLLAEKIGLSQSATSQHLSRLRKSGLVTSRRDAQTVYYSSQSAAVGKLLGVMEEVFGSGEPARSVATA